MSDEFQGIQILEDTQANESLETLPQDLQDKLAVAKSGTAAAMGIEIDLKQFDGIPADGTAALNEMEVAADTTPDSLVSEIEDTPVPTDQIFGPSHTDGAEMTAEGIITASAVVEELPLTQTAELPDVGESESKTAATIESAQLFENENCQEGVVMSTQPLDADLPISETEFMVGKTEAFNSATEIFPCAEEASIACQQIQEVDESGLTEPPKTMSASELTEELSLIKNMADVTIEFASADSKNTNEPQEAAKATLNSLCETNERSDSNISAKNIDFAENSELPHASCDEILVLEDSVQVAQAGCNTVNLLGMLAESLYSEAFANETVGPDGMLFTEVRVNISEKADLQQSEEMALDFPPKLDADMILPDNSLEQEFSNLDPEEQTRDDIIKQTDKSSMQEPDTKTESSSLEAESVSNWKTPEQHEQRLDSASSAVEHNQGNGVEADTIIRAVAPSDEAELDEIQDVVQSEKHTHSAFETSLFPSADAAQPVKVSNVNMDEQTNFVAPILSFAAVEVNDAKSASQEMESEVVHRAKNVSNKESTTQQALTHSSDDAELLSRATENEKLSIEPDTSNCLPEDTESVRKTASPRQEFAEVEASQMMTRTLETAPVECISLPNTSVEPNFLILEDNEACSVASTVFNIEPPAIRQDDSKRIVDNESEETVVQGAGSIAMMQLSETENLAGVCTDTILLKSNIPHLLSQITYLDLDDLGTVQQHAEFSSTPNLVMEANDTQRDLPDELPLRQVEAVEPDRLPRPFENPAGIQDVGGPSNNETELEDVSVEKLELITPHTVNLTMVEKPAICETESSPTDASAITEAVPCQEPHFEDGKTDGNSKLQQFHAEENLTPNIGAEVNDMNVVPENISVPTWTSAQPEKSKNEMEPLEHSRYVQKSAMPPDKTAPVSAKATPMAGDLETEAVREVEIETLESDDSEHLCKTEEETRNSTDEKCEVVVTSSLVCNSVTSDEMAKALEVPDLDRIANDAVSVFDIAETMLQNAEEGVAIGQKSAGLKNCSAPVTVEGNAQVNQDLSFSDSKNEVVIAEQVEIPACNLPDTGIANAMPALPKLSSVADYVEYQNRENISKSVESSVEIAPLEEPTRRDVMVAEEKEPETEIDDLQQAGVQPNEVEPVSSTQNQGENAPPTSQQGSKEDAFLLRPSIDLSWSVTDNPETEPNCVTSEELANQKFKFETESGGNREETPALESSVHARGPSPDAPQQTVPLESHQNELETQAKELITCEAESLTDAVTARKPARTEEVCVEEKHESTTKEWRHVEMQPGDLPVLNFGPATFVQGGVELAVLPMTGSVEEEGELVSTPVSFIASDEIQEKFELTTVELEAPVIQAHKLGASRGEGEKIAGPPDGLERPISMDPNSSELVAEAVENITPSEISHHVTVETDLLESIPSGAQCVLENTAQPDGICFEEENLANNLGELQNIEEPTSEIEPLPSNKELLKPMPSSLQRMDSIAPVPNDLKLSEKIVESSSGSGNESDQSVSASETPEIRSAELKEHNLAISEDQCYLPEEIAERVSERSDKPEGKQDEGAQDACEAAGSEQIQAFEPSVPSGETLADESNVLERAIRFDKRPDQVAAKNSHLDKTVAQAFDVEVFSTLLVESPLVDSIEFAEQKEIPAASEVGNEASGIAADNWTSSSGPMNEEEQESTSNMDSETVRESAGLTAATSVNTCDPCNKDTKALNDCSALRLAAGSGDVDLMQEKCRSICLLFATSDADDLGIFFAEIYMLVSTNGHSKCMKVLLSNDASWKSAADGCQRIVTPALLNGIHRGWVSVVRAIAESECWPLIVKQVAANALLAKALNYVYSIDASVGVSPEFNERKRNDAPCIDIGESILFPHSAAMIEAMISGMTGTNSVRLSPLEPGSINKGMGAYMFLESIHPNDRVNCDSIKNDLLILSAWLGHEATMAAIISVLQPDIQGAAGRNAVKAAASAGHATIIAALFSAGVNFDAVGPDALQIAKKRGHSDACQYLQVLETVRASTIVKVSEEPVQNTRDVGVERMMDTSKNKDANVFTIASVSEEVARINGIVQQTDAFPELTSASRSAHSPLEDASYNNLDIRPTTSVSPAPSSGKRSIKLFPGSKFSASQKSSISKHTTPSSQTKSENTPEGQSQHSSNAVDAARLSAWSRVQTMTRKRAGSSIETIQSNHNVGTHMIRSEFVYQFPDSQRLKQHIINGIPSAWRGHVWFHLLTTTSGIQQKMSPTEAIEFEESLIVRYRGLSNEKSEYSDEIASDVLSATTSPSRAHKLTSILNALCLRDLKVGYICSMCWTANLMLRIFDLDDEKVFVAMVHLFARGKAAPLAKSQTLQQTDAKWISLPRKVSNSSSDSTHRRQSKYQFWQLYAFEWTQFYEMMNVHEHLLLRWSPVLKKRLDAINVTSIQFASGWLLSLFEQCQHIGPYRSTPLLPYHIVLRILDNIFLWGFDALPVLSAAILKWYEPLLIRLTPNCVLGFLRNTTELSPPHPLNQWTVEQEDRFFMMVADLWVDASKPRLSALVHRWGKKKGDDAKMSLIERIRYDWAQA
ncbi:hypothetical protein BJ741DRAFT_602661 [Chytriomyces cf. hyalinus JEL632]|nr:hypothetical protein BJ741DRAFT_602661 [Chytriomyces cf. hyalinus JEL632]